mgnify:CR=1 FL=1
MRWNSLHDKTLIALVRTEGEEVARAAMPSVNPSSYLHSLCWMGEYSLVPQINASVQRVDAVLQTCQQCKPLTTYAAQSIRRKSATHPHVPRKVHPIAHSHAADIALGDDCGTGDAAADEVGIHLAGGGEGDEVVGRWRVEVRSGNFCCWCGSRCGEGDAGQGEEGGKECQQHLDLSIAVLGESANKRLTRVMGRSAALISVSEQGVTRRSAGRCVPSTLGKRVTLGCCS